MQCFEKHNDLFTEHESLLSQIEITEQNLERAKLENRKEDILTLSIQLEELNTKMEQNNDDLDMARM